MHRRILLLVPLVFFGCGVDDSGIFSSAGASSAAGNGGSGCRAGSQLWRRWHDPLRFSRPERNAGARRTACRFP